MIENWLNIYMTRAKHELPFSINDSSLKTNLKELPQLAKNFVNQFLNEEAFPCIHEFSFF